MHVVPRLVAAEDVDSVVRGLVGVVDVDDGPTDEQLAVLRAIVVHLFERDDLDLTNVVPLGPEETAGLLTSPDAELRTAAAAAFGGGASADRQKVLAEYRDALKSSGDPERGRAVFVKTCSAWPLTQPGAPGNWRAASAATPA